MAEEVNQDNHHGSNSQSRNRGIFSNSRFLRSTASLSPRPDSPSKKPTKQPSQNRLKVVSSLGSLTSLTSLKNWSLVDLRDSWRSSREGGDSNDNESEEEQQSQLDTNLPRFKRRGLTMEDGRVRADRKVNPYPLPIDGPEVNRQNLFLMNVMHAFGGPFCSPQFAQASPSQDQPLRVLEVACGSAAWSHACHDYFVRKGIHNVAFYGLDLYNMTPNFRKLGINFTFVRHDIRLKKKRKDNAHENDNDKKNDEQAQAQAQAESIPFREEFFDFIFIKDASLITTIDCGFIEKYLALLKPGGSIEVWDSEHKFRTLRPQKPGSGLSSDARAQAEKTKTYAIGPRTSWAMYSTKNPRLQEYNAWVEKGFNERKLSVAPSSTISNVFLVESDLLQGIGRRRLAIPLNRMPWERGYETGKHEEAKKMQQDPSSAGTLTQEQLALRQTTMTSVVSFIAGMEPLLKNAAGTDMEDWDLWWSALAHTLRTEEYEPVSLEVGAWWGQKRKYELSESWV